MDVPALVDPELAEGLAVFPRLGDLRLKRSWPARAVMVEAGHLQAETAGKGQVLHLRASYRPERCPRI
jgi:hypothetical protein